MDGHWGCKILRSDGARGWRFKTSKWIEVCFGLWWLLLRMQDKFMDIYRTEQTFWTAYRKSGTQRTCICDTSIQSWNIINLLIQLSIVVLELPRRFILDSRTTVLLNAINPFRNNEKNEDEESFIWLFKLAGSNRGGCNLLLNTPFKFCLISSLQRIVFSLRRHAYGPSDTCCTEKWQELSKSEEWIQCQELSRSYFTPK